MSMSVYQSSGYSRIERMTIYDTLNDDGKFFVDFLAHRLLKRAALTGVKKMGIDSARELTLALLQHCWDGSIPAEFPVLVEA